MLHVTAYLPIKINNNNYKGAHVHVILVVLPLM